MNQEIKQLWVNGLRSGDYEQGKNHLKNMGRYCCLGVLCEISPYSWEEILPLGNSYLPPFVIEWAGISKQSDYYEEGFLPEPVQYNGQERVCLVHLNDSGMPFAEIADVIEEQFWSFKSDSAQAVEELDYAETVDDASPRGQR